MEEKLEEAGGATSTQIALNKKREAELLQLRRDMDASNMNHEEQMGNQRKKHNDAVTEMGDQLDQMQAARNRYNHSERVLRSVLDDNYPSFT